MRAVVKLFGAAAVVLAALLHPAAEALPTEVIVELFQSRGAVLHLGLSGPLELVEPRHERFGAGGFEAHAEHGQVVLMRTERGARRQVVAGDRLVLRGALGLVQTSMAGAASRSYRGLLIVEQSRTGGLKVRNKLPAKDYVLSVIGSETNPNFPLEEIKAQAVITQTLLARYKPNDWLGDSTEKEAYLGAEFERPAGRQAVEAVWGEILAYKNLPAQLYFHSTCGGGTSDGETYFELKHGAFPYLSARPCDFCKSSPFWKPTVSVVSAAASSKAFGVAVPTILEKDRQSRPLQVRLAGHTTTGYRFWMSMGQRLGWDKAPGTRYSIEQRKDGAVVISSTGAGHGIGLCQWGASELARRGKTYSEILAYYFPGTAIQKTK